MRLSNSKIEELQALYRKHFGKEITTENAQTLGIALVRLAMVKKQRQELTHKERNGYEKLASEKPTAKS